MPTVTTGINQHSPLDRLTPAPHIHTQKLNNRQGTEKDRQQRGQGVLSAPEKGEGARSCSPGELLVNKACKSSQQASPSTRKRRRR
jgi:hypothetical protein